MAHTKNSENSEKTRKSRNATDIKCANISSLQSVLVEKISNELNIRYHREEQNLFVNPAWNKIFEQENCKYLTLLNNDCFILSQNYFEDVIEHMEKYGIGISSCKNKNILKLK